MNIKRAKEEICNTIEAYLQKDEFGVYRIPPVRQRPVLLIGPPGIGKTQIMEQAARESGVGLVAYTITHHTRQSAIGLPYIEKREYGGREYSVTEYTMSEIVASVYESIRRTGLKEGILFLDEINCVSETLAPAMLQFLQGKTFGNHRIPDGWIIVAAGNPPEFNKSVREFDVVTLDRVKMITVEPDFAAWKEYAYREHIHQAVISYLDVKQDCFCRIETTVDGKRFATPRGWEDLSRLIQVYESLGKDIDRDVVSQYIQYPKIASDFANYLELYHRYETDYQIQEILAGRVAPGIYDRLERAPFDERLSVVSLVLAGLTEAFREALWQEEKTGLLQKWLREFADRTGLTAERSVEGGSSGGTPEQAGRLWEEILEEIVKEFQLDREKKNEAGLLSRREDRLQRQAGELLERFLQTLKKERPAHADAAWSRLKELFGEENERYQQLMSRAETMLEHGFDFMEGAFGNSQEMVVFITQLNTSAVCAAFLQEYACERYYEYNENLLFENREESLKKRAAMEIGRGGI